MSNRTSLILGMLSRAGQNPGSHDEWMQEWNKLYEEFESSPAASGNFAELEHTALGALANIDTADTYVHLRSEFCRVLDTSKHPAFLVDEQGVVSAMNMSAINVCNIAVGEHVDNLNIDLQHAESISHTSKRVLHSSFPKGKVVFKQGCFANSSHSLTMVFTASKLELGSAALVFLISSSFREKAARWYKSSMT